MKSDTTLIHTKVHRVFIDRHELKEIVIKAISDSIGIELTESVEIKFDIKEETEGSPAYKVGYGCVVVITENLI